MAEPTRTLAWRNRGGEWLAHRQDFEHGRLVTEATLDGGMANPLSVGSHDFLWVVPLRLSPSEARAIGPAAYEIKRIIGIHKIENTSRVIFLCTDYLRSAQLHNKLEVDVNDEYTRRLLTQISLNGEVVRTSSRSYIWQNRVEDVALVTSLNACGATFPPLFPRQLYARDDIYFDVVTQGPSNPKWVAHETPCQYCGEKCYKFGFYAPHLDTMRFCEACEKWYHLACIGEKRTGQDMAIFVDDEAHDDDRHVRDPEFTLWEHALNAPITRAPRTDDPYTNEPYSIETILKPLRLARNAITASESFRALPEFEKYVNALPAVAQHAPYYRDDLVEYVLAETQNADVETYGDCPSCAVIV